MNSLPKENIEILLKNFFIGNHIEERILKNKSQLKELYQIKLKLVDVIKDNEVLVKQLNNGYDYSEIEEGGNLNQSNGIIRPKTPDINSNKKGTHIKGLNRTMTIMNGNSDSKGNCNSSRPNTKENIIPNSNANKTFNQSNGAKFSIRKMNSNKPRDNTPIKNAKKSITANAKPITNDKNAKKRKSHDINKSNSKGEENTNTNSISVPSVTPIPIPMSKAQPITDKPSILDYIHNRINKRLNQYSSKSIEALHLCILSNYLGFKDIMTLLMSTNELYQINKGLIKNHLSRVIETNESKLNGLNATLSKYDSSILYKLFTPTKTAINGLNFITKEEESNLRKKSQSPPIVNIFKVILIMFNESYEGIEDNDIISHLFTHLMPKYNCESLKSLLGTKLGKSIDSQCQCTNDSITKLIQLNALNPRLFSAIELIKLNRTVSYMNFILKEYYDYLSFKFPEGEYLYTIRPLLQTRDTLKETISYLKSFLAN